MKKLSVLLLLMVVFLVSCNSKPSGRDAEKTAETEKISQTASKTAETEKTVCDLLSRAYLLKKFPEAAGFKQQSRQEPYPGCSWRFKYSGDNYKIGITRVTEYASEKNLEKAVSYFNDAETVSGLGKKAFYIPAQGQFSVFTGKYIVHVYATVHEKGNRELAEKVIRDMLAEM